MRQEHWNIQIKMQHVIHDESHSTSERREVVDVFHLSLVALTEEQAHRKLQTILKAHAESTE